MLTLEQKKRRQQGLGGSDIAALLGINPYKTKQDLWIEKTIPMLFLEEDEPSEAIRWGNLLEPVILQRYIEIKQQENPKLQLDHSSSNNMTIHHPNYPYLLATPDALFIKEEEYSHGLEIKTTAFHNKKKWGESFTKKIPEAYYLQIVHYMLVTGIPYWDVAVLIGGNDFRIYHFIQDIDTENKIIEAASDFWHNHVIPKISPLENIPLSTTINIF